jgi:hypothetical protein
MKGCLSIVHQFPALHLQGIIRTDDLQEVMTSLGLFSQLFTLGEMHRVRIPQHGVNPNGDQAQLADEVQARRKCLAGVEHMFSDGWSFVLVEEGRFYEHLQIENS